MIRFKLLRSSWTLNILCLIAAIIWNKYWPSRKTNYSNKLILCVCLMENILHLIKQHKFYKRNIFHVLYSSAQMFHKCKSKNFLVFFKKLNIIVWYSNILQSSCPGLPSIFLLILSVFKKLGPFYLHKTQQIRMIAFSSWTQNITWQRNRILECHAQTG